MSPLRWKKLVSIFLGMILVWVSCTRLTNVTSFQSSKKLQTSLSPSPVETSPSFSSIVRDGKIAYSALGDSITEGNIGPTSNCGLPAPSSKPMPVISPVPASPTCDHATNYAGMLAKQLDSFYPTTYQNLGIGGEKIQGVIRQEIPNLDPNATLVTLYIGTNDSYTLAKAEDYTEPLLSDRMSHWKRDYQLAIDQIKIKAPMARLVLLNVPNQSKFEFAPMFFNSTLVATLNEIAVEMNRFIDTLSSSYPVADLVCDPQTYDSNLIMGGVHLKDEANLLLSRKLFNTITNVPRVAPKPSCSPYI